MVKVRSGVGVALALVVCGCGSEQVISKEELETGVNEALVEANRRPEKVTCEGAVKAQAAESISCVMTAGGADYEVTVVVMSVDGDKATYDIDVAGEPNR